MRTVPANVVGFLLAEEPQLRALTSGYGVQVGQRVEVDLDRLGEEHPVLAQVLGSYHQQAVDLWGAVGLPGRVAGAYRVTSRVVVDAVQNTGKPRRDLTEHFACLRDVPLLAGVLDALTAAEVDPKQARGAVRAAGGQVGQVDGVWDAWIPLPGGQTWPDEIGGVPWPFEVGRYVQLFARHAPWRDRRVRRLAQVQVIVDELWPEPAQARAALTSLH